MANNSTNYKITLIKRLAAETETKLEPWVLQYSEGFSEDINDLSNVQLNLLWKALQEKQVDQISRMRKKIIHQLCLYGMTDVAGKPDMKRIQAFVQGIGSRNPHKKNLFRLSKNECRNVLNQVEVMVKKTIHKS